METELKRGKRRINLTDVENCIRAARDRAGELLSAARSLPKVDDEGNSDCPVAEELYAKKEKLQQEVEGLFKRLHECKADVEYLIDNCKRNLAVVSANEDMLNSDRPRAKFSEAEAALAAKYKAYVRLRDRIEEAIKIVDKALREAAGKRYPGKIPEERPGTRFSPQPTDPDRQPASERSGADKELDDLFELDRRSRAASSQDSDDAL
jgi:phage host-nuclease inhibitor protein Gam